MARKVKRHFLEIWKPPETLDDRGRPVGDPVKVAEEVPASILEKTGSEIEAAQQLIATKQIEVELFIDPAWGLAEHFWFVQMDNGRRLNILEIRDKDATDWEVICMCGEVRS